MLSKFFMLKVMLLLVLVLLVMSVVLGIPVFANGGGGQPYPPTQNPPQGDPSGNLFVVALLTTLQIIL